MRFVILVRTRFFIWTIRYDSYHMMHFISENHWRSIIFSKIRKGTFYMWCIVREWNRIKINLIFFLVDLIKKDFFEFSDWGFGAKYRIVKSAKLFRLGRNNDFMTFHDVCLDDYDLEGEKKWESGIFWPHVPGAWSNQRPEMTSQIVYQQVKAN